MVELKTAEHVAHFMQSTIKLSRYDEKFITSIIGAIQVTTNQVELFYKIIYKYRRQFSNHELNVDDLIYLPWTAKVIESLPDYTEGHIEIVDNKIIFKCPYNRNFVTEFRKENTNPFIWNKEKRYYESDYGTYQLKLVATTSVKFFKTVNFCPTTTSLLETLYSFENVKYWHPTLVKVNGNFIIHAMNEAIDNALGDMKIDDNPKTLSRLVQYGVIIDDSVIDKNDPKHVFISTMISKVEVLDALNIVEWLKEIECDFVYFSGTSLLNTLKKQVQDELLDAGIPFGEVHLFAKNTNSIIKNKNFPVIVRFKSNQSSSDPHRVGKIIQLVNSMPVNIK
jgi:hypothetical protein